VDISPGEETEFTDQLLGFPQIGMVIDGANQVSQGNFAELLPTGIWTLPIDNRSRDTGPALIETGRREMASQLGVVGIQTRVEGRFAELEHLLQVFERAGLEVEFGSLVEFREPWIRALVVRV